MCIHQFYSILTIKSVLNKVLENAREHVVCEGRDCRWIGVFVGCFGGEADEQHCLAGDFELVLGFACYLVSLAPPGLHLACTAILASVVNLNVVLQTSMTVFFLPAVPYKCCAPILAPRAIPSVHVWRACEGWL